MLKGEGEFEDVEFSLDGKWVAVASSDGLARVWEVARPARPPIVLRGHSDQLRAVQFLPGDRLLATGAGDTTIRLWDYRGARPVTRAVLRGHADTLQDLALLPAEQRLASASDDGSVRVWDLRRLSEPPLVIEAPAVAGRPGWAGRRGRTVAFSPDGKVLAHSGDLDGVLYEPWRTEVVAERACGSVWRDLTAAEWKDIAGPSVRRRPLCPGRR